MSGKGGGRGGGEGEMNRKGNLYNFLLPLPALLILKRFFQQWWRIFANWSQSKTENDVERYILPGIQLPFVLAGWPQGSSGL